jgi:hypothetical protein
MEAGAIGGIVVDNNADSAMASSPMFAMSGDGTDDVTIPVVFLFSQDAWKLLNALTQDPTTIVTLADRQLGKVYFIRVSKYSSIYYLFASFTLLLNNTLKQFMPKIIKSYLLYFYLSINQGYSLKK